MSERRTQIERAYEQGRYQEALEQARALDAAGLPEGTRMRCLAAFRLGELDESAQAALRVITPAQRAADSASAPPSEGDTFSRFSVLAVSVVAAGELARFEQSIEHLQLMQATASRAGSLSEFVRGRGTTATCFALLGDPWAAQRLFSELVGLFQAGSPERRLEATVRTNHASVCLQIARLARQGGDAQACEEALEHASASLERTREIARESGEARVAAFADVHAAELSLLRGQAEPALALLDGAVAHADAAGLWAHARQLRLLEAEAWLAQSDSIRARALLDAVAQRLNEGHELGARIRWHAQMQRVASAEGASAGALAHLEQARALAQYRQYRQARAQSRYLRTRLELEHIYRFRPEAHRASVAQPGALTAN